MRWKRLYFVYLIPVVGRVAKRCELYNIWFRSWCVCAGFDTCYLAKIPQFPSVSLLCAGPMPGNMRCQKLSDSSWDKIKSTGHSRERHTAYSMWRDTPMHLPEKEGAGQQAKSSERIEFWIWALCGKSVCLKWGRGLSRSTCQRALPSTVYMALNSVNSLHFVVCKSDGMEGIISQKQKSACWLRCPPAVPPQACSAEISLMELLPTAWFSEEETCWTLSRKVVPLLTDG